MEGVAHGLTPRRCRRTRKELARRNACDAVVPVEDSKAGRVGAGRVVLGAWWGGGPAGSGGGRVGWQAGWGGWPGRGAGLVGGRA